MFDISDSDVAMKKALELPWNELIGVFKGKIITIENQEDDDDECKNKICIQDEMNIVVNFAKASKVECKQWKCVEEEPNTSPTSNLFQTTHFIKSLSFNFHFVLTQILKVNSFINI